MVSATALTVSEVLRSDDYVSCDYGGGDSSAVALLIMYARSVAHNLWYSR